MPRTARIYPSVRRCLVSEPLYDPLLVVVLIKLKQHQPRLLNCFKCFYPQKILLQSSDETLSKTVALGMSGQSPECEESEPLCHRYGDIGSSLHTNHYRITVCKQNRSGILLLLRGRGGRCLFGPICNGCLPDIGRY